MDCCGGSPLYTPIYDEGLASVYIRPVHFGSVPHTSPAARAAAPVAAPVMAKLVSPISAPSVRPRSGTDTTSPASQHRDSVSSRTSIHSTRQLNDTLLSQEDAERLGRYANSCSSFTTNVPESKWRCAGAPLKAFTAEHGATSPRNLAPWLGFIKKGRCCQPDETPEVIINVSQSGSRMDGPAEQPLKDSFEAEAVLLSHVEPVPGHIQGQQVPLLQTQPLTPEDAALVLSTPQKDIAEYTKDQQITDPGVLITNFSAALTPRVVAGAYDSYQGGNTPREQMLVVGSFKLQSLEVPDAELRIILYVADMGILYGLLLCNTLRLRDAVFQVTYAMQNAEKCTPTVFVDRFEPVLAASTLPLVKVMQGFAVPVKKYREAQWGEMVVSVAAIQKQEALHGLYQEHSLTADLVRNYNNAKTGKSPVADVVVECDGEKYAGCRSVMMCRSPVFQRLLADLYRSTVVIKNSDPMYVRNLMDYIHTDKCDMFARDFDLAPTVALMEMAAKFKLEALVHRTAATCAAHLSPNNLAVLYTASKKADNTFLAASCIRYGRRLGTPLLREVAAIPALQVSESSSSVVSNVSTYEEHYVVPAPMEPEPEALLELIQEPELREPTPPLHVVEEMVSLSGSSDHVMVPEVPAREVYLDRDQ